MVNESSFGYEYFEGPGYASIIFSGESKDPDRVAEEIRAEADRLRREGIDREAFQRAKKALYGRNIAALNSVDNIANSMASFAFAGRELYTYIDDLANATLESVQKRLEEQLDLAYSALSVVCPVE